MNSDETTQRYPQPGFSFPEEVTEEWKRAALERINGRGTDLLTHRVGVVYTDVERESMTATLPVAGNLQPAGLLHGGAHLVLAESLGSMHAWMLAGGRAVVGLDINATHVRAVRSGLVTARAEVVHAGRTMIHHEVKMRDESGRLLSTARITNLVVGPARK